MRFLSVIAATATTMMTTAAAIAAMTTIMSFDGFVPGTSTAGDAVVAGTEDVVEGASDDGAVPVGFVLTAGEVVTAAVGIVATPMAVSADEGKYDSEPSKDATILYVPSLGGVHMVAKTPLVSDWAVPMGMLLPSEATAVKVTVTPVAFVGFGLIRWRYPIHALMSCSDTAAVPC